ncbi:MAG: YqgE/AlgH family protein [Pseudomonadota bacterium]
MVKYQTIKPGDIIVSSPHTNKGLIFSKSVILIIAHDKNGTSGVIINKPLHVLHGEEILRSLQLPDSDQKDNITNPDANMSVCFGGPIEQDKGIILHSGDYKPRSAIEVAKDVYISTNSKLIKDIITNNGPKHKVLLLGYASWSAGQLASEIKNNDWYVILEKHKNKNPSPEFNLLFTEDYLFKWNTALELAGINLNKYSGISGNA